jgi:hypothetical protein
MLQVKLVIRDPSQANVRSLPPALLEVAAAESYGPDAVEWRDFLGAPALVYSLHRIAGEKMRAYLTSLPEYRKKMHGGTREFRVKDLHDLARIVRQHPLEDLAFWGKVSEEFKLACESRYVDCNGPATFLQDWAQVRLRYEQDRHLSSISWTEAETALNQILKGISQRRVPLEIRGPCELTSAMFPDNSCPKPPLPYPHQKPLKPFHSPAFAASLAPPNSRSATLPLERKGSGDNRLTNSSFPFPEA